MELGNRSRDRKRSRERRGRSRDGELPNEQGNAHTADVIGSGQKTMAGHSDSGLGKTGIDPRIETGLPENETAREDDRLRRSRPLDSERDEEQERERRPR